MAQSRLVLTNNYQRLINDAEAAVIRKKAQDSIDAAKESNRLATESHKIAEEARISSDASHQLGVKSHRLAWAGVLLALVGICLTLWLSLSSGTPEQQPADSVLDVTPQSTPTPLAVPIDTTVLQQQSPSSNSGIADSLRDSTLAN